MTNHQHPLETVISTALSIYDIGSYLGYSVLNFLFRSILSCSSHSNGFIHELNFSAFNVLKMLLLYLQLELMVRSVKSVSEVTLHLSLFPLELGS